MPFKKGQSGNPGGRPKGIPNLSLRAMIAEALDPETRKAGIARFRDNVTNKKTVISALEFAARVNKEIGQGADGGLAGITINFISNVRPEKLEAARARALVVEAPPVPALNGRNGGRH